MNRLLAQHAAPRHQRGVNGKGQGEGAGGASRAAFEGAPSRRPCSACSGLFSTRATLIPGPTGAALHVASSPGCAGWLGAARAHNELTFAVVKMSLVCYHTLAFLLSIRKNSVACYLRCPNAPHAVRRLCYRARLVIGEEMRPLQHALLWA